MDGGSSDGTLDILKGYGDRVRYVSRRDEGTADAINQGFRISRGSIFAWLNADDAYAPGAVSTAVRHFESDHAAAVVYGRANWVDEAGQHLGPYPAQSFDPDLLRRECYICQPASFIRREAFLQADMLDKRLCLSFDYDLWIRLARNHGFLAVEQVLAASRMHRSNKTLAQRERMFQESFAVLKRHYGYVPFQWIFGYCCYLMDGRDQFYEPLRISFFRYLLSLPLGCWHNPRRLPQYCREWFSKLGRRQFAIYQAQSRLRGPRTTTSGVNSVNAQTGDNI
jgi:glycosyltransferase involved in cell wall biosynthesis